MSDKVFCDTNVLVYAHDSAHPGKRDTAQRLIFDTLGSGAMVLSTQVLSEFYVTATRKLGLSPVDVVEEMHLLSRGRVVDPSLSMLFEAIGVSLEAGLSYWDALIVVSAAAAGCGVLYTEDLQAGRSINGVRVANPFAA
jgi:predicted nucleic acid-binding protein